MYPKMNKHMIQILDSHHMSDFVGNSYQFIHFYQCFIDVFHQCQAKQNAQKKIGLSWSPQRAKSSESSQASVAKAREMAEELAELVEKLREQQKGSSWAYGTSPFFMGKSTIFAAIFNSYLCLPEGNDRYWLVVTGTMDFYDFPIILGME